jgi:hypothetical protein
MFLTGEAAMPTSTTILCPCGVKLNVLPAMAGKKLKCPKCGKVIAAPVPPPDPEVTEVMDVRAGDDDLPVAPDTSSKKAKVPQKAQKPQEPLPLAQVLADFGGVTESFGPSTANIIAGYILSVLATLAGLGGIGGIWYLALKPGGKIEVSTFGVTGACIVLLLAGVVGFFYMRMLWGSGIYLCAEGIIHAGKGWNSSCRWDAVDRIVEYVENEHFPLKHGADKLLPMGKSRCYVIHRDDGEELFFEGNMVKKWGRFSRMLRETAKERDLSFESVAGPPPEDPLFGKRKSAGAK